MFPVRQPWLCKALGAFLYPISANAFINTVDICYLLQQRSLHWKKCARLSWKSVATAFFWLGRFYWESLLELIFFFLLLLPLLSCLLVFWFFLFFLGALLMDLQTVRGLFHSSPTGWKSSPPWRRCVVWLYVRCVPPVCWFIMPPQVVMIAVSGALGQCPTHPWWPPCYFMLAWRYFVAAGTKRWPRLRSWSRLTSPAMFRTLRSWPPCEWRLSKFSDYFLVPDFAVWPDVSLWPPPASSISSTWSTAWHPSSSSMVSCCWLRASMPRAPSSRPLVNSGAPNVAAASAWRWERGGARVGGGWGDVRSLLRCWMLVCLNLNEMFFVSPISPVNCG